MMSKKNFALLAIVLTLLSGIAYLVFSYVLESSQSTVFWKEFAKGALIPSVLMVAYLLLFTQSFRRSK
jgi:hypothetical protein